MEQKKQRRKKQKTKNKPISRGLKPQYKILVDHWLTCFDGTKSAIVAGYSEKHAAHRASVVLAKPEVQEYIGQCMQEMHDKKIADAAEVMAYLTSVMRGEVMDQLGLDPGLSDRNKAAELIGKKLKLFTDKLEVSTIQPVIIKDDLSELEQELDKELENE